MPRLRVSLSLGLLACLVLVGLAAIGVRAQTTSPAGAQAGSQPGSTMMHQEIDPSSLKWEPAPPGLPPGAMVAVLYGDPSKAGEYYVMRLKAPDGFKVMPHTHPVDEHLTVLKGTFMVGMGEKWDAAAMKSLAPQSHAYMPKETAHFAAMKGETIIEASGLGPFGITYINPNDDPRNKKPSSNQ
jgi:hypothetical protein